MAKVKYIKYMGLPHKTHRRLSAADFERIEVPYYEDAEWGPQNDHTVEMSDEASELLVAKLPNHFAVIDESGDSQPFSEWTDDDENDDAE